MTAPGKWLFSIQLVLKIDTKVSPIPSSNCFTLLTSGLIEIIRDVCR
jgi:hypothetical protein